MIAAVQNKRKPPASADRHRVRVFTFLLILAGLPATGAAQAGWDDYQIIV